MNREQLKAIIPVLSAKYKFRTGIIEKDFYITFILNNVNEKLSENIVLKSGTLLNKIYFNCKRLSEDIDFTYISSAGLDTRSKRSKAIRPIKEKMKGFLKYLNLKSPNIGGKGFDESQQYVFYILYPSIVTGKNENIKLEISLKQFPIEKPVKNKINHFYKDPFTGDNLIPSGNILSLSMNEAIAEKLKAAITRKEIAIRDYYDLWHISELKFDFKNEKFIKLFEKKLEGESYKGNYKKNFGLNEKAIISLNKQIESALMPVIRTDEKFDLNKVFKKFNEIFE